METDGIKKALRTSQFGGFTGEHTEIPVFYFLNEKRKITGHCITAGKGTIVHDESGIKIENSSYVTKFVLHVPHGGRPIMYREDGRPMSDDPVAAEKSYNEMIALWLQHMKDKGLFPITLNRMVYVEDAGIRWMITW